MKISIVTAVLNGEKTIGHAIRSILDQTHKEIEHIIIDGGSTDGTLRVIEGYHPYPGRVLSEPDRGIYDAMNKGIALASGEVIGILNADDFYKHGGVLAQVAKVFEDPALDSCYGDLDYVDSADTSRVIRRWQAGPHRPESFYWGWMPPHPAFFARRKAYQTYGGYNLELGSAADYELMLRFLLKYRITTTYIREILVCMRTGGVSNISLTNRIRANRMDRKAWRVNGLKPYPWTLWLKPIRKVGQFVLR